MSGVRVRRRIRAPTVSEKFKETEQEQVVRKSLAILQPTANNPVSLVGHCGTSASRKIEKLKPVLESKENSPMKPRRSKRKAAVSSCEESKVSSSTPIANDTKNAENSNLKQQTLTKYSKKLVAQLKETPPVIQEEDKKEILEHPEAGLFGNSIRSESSGYCSDGLEKLEGSLKSRDSTHSNLITEEAADETDTLKRGDCIPASKELQITSSIPQDVHDLLISDKVPDSYWQDLAEQRRLALEEALHDNELLRDQLEVMEAENSRLTSLVNDAEKLAEIVKDVLGP